MLQKHARLRVATQTQQAFGFIVLLVKVLYVHKKTTTTKINILIKNSL